MKYPALVAASVIFAAVGACVAPSGTPSHEPPHTAIHSGLLPMSVFQTGMDAGLSAHAFAGALSLRWETHGFRVHRDALALERNAELRLQKLPDLKLQLEQDGETLLPAQRGPIPSGHPSWEFSVEPGRVWSEPDNRGLTRAALPFALIETLANCTHNGVFSFTFDGTKVSDVIWQVASETCAYLQFDAWGVASATYNPSPGRDEAAIAAFRAERAARMPARPFADLRAKYPGIDLDAFASPADIEPASLTTFGLVVDGVHYTGECGTRAGPYPFCEALLVPSYSLAKSLVAGLGLMRFELLHAGIMQAKIGVHVGACSDWTDVSFEDALDMASGRFESAEDQVDENELTAGQFFIAPSHRGKIALACNAFPRREAPAGRWVYHTSDTYIVGAAMQDAWRDKYGADADFFDDVLVDGVYQPLRLSPTSHVIRRTKDDARQPFTGWGLTLLRDDVAKLGAYLASAPRGEALVSPSALDAALQRDPTDTGLTAGSDDLRYNNGFWAYNAQHVLACDKPVWIPFLSGFGGVIVALMPNGAVYYYVSDGGDFAWARAVKAAEAFGPMCPRSSP